MIQRIGILTDSPAAVPDSPASATHRWRLRPGPPGRHCGRSGTVRFSHRWPLRCCPPPDGWKTQYTTRWGSAPSPPSPSKRRWWPQMAPSGCCIPERRHSIPDRIPPQNTGWGTGHQRQWSFGEPLQRSPGSPDPADRSLRHSPQRRPDTPPRAPGPALPVFPRWPG